MFLGRVHSQTRYLRSLQSSVGSRVPVALIVAEDAVVQRAPASTKLCRGVEERLKRRSARHAGWSPEASPTFSAFAVSDNSSHGTRLEQEAIERDGGRR